MLQQLSHLADWKLTNFQLHNTVFVHPNSSFSLKHQLSLFDVICHYEEILNYKDL